MDPVRKHPLLKLLLKTPKTENKILLYGMGKKSFPKSLLVFILSILGFQSIAVIFYWYWRIPWFDILMHFLGGVWVGMTVLWLYVYSERIKVFGAYSRPAMSLLVLITVLVVAILWEVFEFGIFISIPSGVPYNGIDTAIDLIAGVCGGIFAVFLFNSNKLLSIYRS